jgi:hypothetical protein
VSNLNDSNQESSENGLIPASMWTRSDIQVFKQAVAQAEGDGVVRVGHGETVTVRVPTHPEGSRLFWEFATDHYDIGNFNLTKTYFNKLLLGNLQVLEYILSMVPQQVTKYQYMCQKVMMKIWKMEMKTHMMMKLFKQEIWRPVPWPLMEFQNRFSQKLCQFIEETVKVRSMLDLTSIQGKEYTYLNSIIHIHYGGPKLSITECITHTNLFSYYCLL